MILCSHSAVAEDSVLFDLMVSLLANGCEESKIHLHLSSPRVLIFEDDLSTLEEEVANLPRNVCNQLPDDAASYKTTES
jgi:hypothetical protein